MQIDEKILRRALNKNRLSPEEFCAMAKISTATLYKLLRGRQCSRTTMDRIEEALESLGEATKVAG